jgi:hypothetical protein
MAKAKHDSKLKGFPDKPAGAAGTATSATVIAEGRGTAKRTRGTRTAGVGTALTPARGGWTDSERKQLRDIKKALRSTPSAATAGGPRKKRAKDWQTRRVRKTLPKLYPDGEVPDDVPTETVRGRVAKELETDSNNRGLAAPSWDTVNRALGRG